ncbi:MAG: chloride channel protein [Hyphomonadaceae bacterium]
MPSFPRSLARRASVLWRRYGSRLTQEQIAVARRRFATGVGAVLVGLAALAFARAGDGAQHLFAQLTRWSPYAPLLVTPATFALAIYFTRRWAPQIQGSGIPQIIAASKDPAAAGANPLVSLRTAVMKFALTLLGLAGGGSFGREGPTVQISAAIMVGVHKLMRVPITPGVLIAGGGAGVAAAFNTPLAGVAFAIEELAAAYEQRIAILVMGAVMIAGLVSLGIAGDYVYFGVMRDTLDLTAALTIAPLMGVVGGLLGGVFSRTLLAAAAPKRPLLQRLKRRPILFAAGCGLVVALLGVLTGGETFGTGYEVSRNLVEGQAASIWFAPAKLAATIASALSGNAGGIFAPSLSVGAGIGGLMQGFFPDAPTGAIVVLGMIGYFTGVVRAPFTAVIIVSEATASRGMILPLFVAALVADGVSALVCRQRLYHGLAQQFMPKAS